MAHINAHTKTFALRIENERSVFIFCTTTRSICGFPSRNKKRKHPFDGFYIQTDGVSIKKFKKNHIFYSNGYLSETRGLISRTLLKGQFEKLLYEPQLIP